jgi:hypothetical protein
LRRRLVVDGVDDGLDLGLGRSFANKAEDLAPLRGERRGYRK